MVYCMVTMVKTPRFETCRFSSLIWPMKSADGWCELVWLWADVLEAWQVYQLSTVQVRKIGISFCINYSSKNEDGLRFGRAIFESDSCIYKSEGVELPSSQQWLKQLAQATPTLVQVLKKWDVAVAFIDVKLTWALIHSLAAILSPVDNDSPASCCRDLGSCNPIQKCQKWAKRKIAAEKLNEVFLPHFSS